MAALAASTTQASSSKLHAQVDALTASATDPFALESNRERFADRALRDVTVNSNDAALMLDPGNPLLVKDEMDAQKEYFRRLKFTYLEQEAKRNFLFSIMGDEPQGVQPGENEALEQSNAQRKAELKAFKAEVENMREESIRLAKENNARSEKAKQEISEAARLQKQIRDMELELARIKATHPPENRLTNAQAGDLLDEQIVEMQRLTDATSTTNVKVEKTRDEVSSTTKEVKRLEREREREEARAKEVREGRKAGDTKVDELCRWLSTSMQFYRSLLAISSVHASARGTSHLLHITYDVPAAPSLTKSTKARNKATEGVKQVKLVLEFDPATKRLINAQLVGSDLDIQEVVGMSIGSNDVAGLVADVLSRLRPIQL